MADFTTIKTYNGATATSAPALAVANFTEVAGKPKQQGRPRIVELRVGGYPTLTDAPAVGGSVAPSAVYVDLWRFNRADGTRDFIKTWTILAADITSGRIECPIYEAWGIWLSTSIRFPDGTTPTFTGSIQARVLE